jgi:hypothetical protein
LHFRTLYTPSIACRMKNHTTGCIDGLDNFWPDNVP